MRLGLKRPYLLIFIATRLIAIIKKQLNLDVSLHTLLQILSVTVFEKIELTQVVADSASQQKLTMFDNQLNLFDS